MFLFDTNIFLEILLDQEHAEVCQEALQLPTSESPGWLTHFSLHAIEALVGHRRRFAVLQRFLEFVNEHPHLYVYATSLEEERSIATFASDVGLDFDDALQLYVVKKQQGMLITLDRDFRKVRNISILSPHAALRARRT